jgi:signal peptidase
VITLLAGVIGVTCLLMLVAPAVGVRIVVIVTGSMRPALLPGAIVVTRDTPASQIRVNDIVTVARSGDTDVTHRVIAIDEGHDLLGTMLLTLKGDANASPDPAPYEVQSARVVIASVPGGGQVVLLLRQPATIAMLSVLVAALVLWNWWPAREVES